MPKSPIEMMLDNVTWTPIKGAASNNDGIPYATHSGVLEILGMTLRVHQLNDGSRMIEQPDMAAFLAAMAGDDPRFTPAQNEWLHLLG